MQFERNTRIICTMGPAVESVEKVRELIQNGMNIARFNFSHGDHTYHKAAVERVREAARLEGVPIALLLDTKGPEIRTGTVAGGKSLVLKKDALIRVMSEEHAREMDGGAEVFATEERMVVSYTGLSQDVKPGARILIADGLVALEVLSVSGPAIDCRVLDGGEFGSKKNVNVIGVKTRLPAVTDKDKDDLRFAAENGMDFIAASFVRKAQDVVTIQQYLASVGSDIPVIAKIEDEEGLDNIEDIIRVSAGVMVARGDLGVQVPTERVPLEQKRIISLCNHAGKPVITATQMLESMIKNPRPTRAEAADVANAILDGTDCVMLSGETASGQYPAQAVSMMKRIAFTVETSDEYRKRIEERRETTTTGSDIAQTIAEAASWTADRLGAAALVIPTMSGNTARLVSRHRPRRRIIAATVDPSTQRRLLLHWGVVPILVDKEDDSESMIQGAISATLRAGFAKPLDTVVVVAGLPLNSPLQTNSVRVHVIGNVLGRGGKGFGGRCTGRIVKAADLAEAAMSLRKAGGDILVTNTLDESFIPILRLVKGVILEGVSAISWDVIRQTNPAIVYISQMPKAMSCLEDHLTITLDGEAQLVYEGAL